MTSNQLSRSSHSQERSAWFGQVAFVAGVLILLSQGLTTSGQWVWLPRSWHQNPTLWTLIGLTGIAVGGYLLFQSGIQREAALRWQPTRPGRRFREIVLYNRDDCHLCHEAEDLLIEYWRWLPRPTVIDIDTNPDLVRLYGTSIPVVVCDGRIRFKGRIAPELLQRLIEGTPPLQGALPEHNLT